MLRKDGFGIEASQPASPLDNIRVETPHRIAENTQERRNRSQMGGKYTFPGLGPKTGCFSGLRGRSPVRRPPSAGDTPEPRFFQQAICGWCMAGTPGTGGAGRDPAKACPVRDPVSRISAIASCVRRICRGQARQSSGAVVRAGTNKHPEFADSGRDPAPETLSRAAQPQMHGQSPVKATREART